MNLELTIEKLTYRISDLEIENHKLHETVEYLTRKLYGRSSEKTSAIVDGQLSFFDEVESHADEAADEPDLKQVQSYRRKKYKGQRAEPLKDLPRIKRLCALAE